MELREIVISAGIWTAILGSALLLVGLLTRVFQPGQSVSMALLRTWGFVIALTLVGFLGGISQQLDVADPSFAILILSAVLGITAAVALWLRRKPNVLPQ